MARQVRRISQLPEAEPLTGDELIEIVQDGDNFRLRVDDLPGGAGGGSGVTYVQDHEPTSATESETWWNPLTLQLKVYHNKEFEPVSPDGGHF